MPVETPPPSTPEIDLDSEPLKLSSEDLSKIYALQLVKDSFNRYSLFRYQNHDARWNEQEALYFGWRPVKTWPGSKIPRSNLGMQIVFDQVESALPAIEQNIFGPEDDWFQVAPEPGASTDEARAIQAHLSYILEHTRDDEGLTVRTELGMAFKDILLYGNGGVIVEYDPTQRRPRPRWVSIKDIYIDPGSQSPSVADSRSVIWRRLMTVDEIEDLRGIMDIPDSSILVYMSKNRPLDYADTTKRNQEAIRGVSFNPTVSDYSPNPAQRQVEVLVYYSKSRIIWVLNRQWVAYNEKNPYGFIPFCFGPCYSVPSRWYAQSVADVQEGNQRYIEGLLNGRLDEMTLAIFPPRVQVSGSLLTPSQQRWSPGHVFQVRDPKDVATLQPNNATASVYQEIGYIESASEKRTGINAGAQSGVPRPGNVNRTAFGVQSTMAGTANRLQKLVRNIEDYLIVPMLYKMYKMVQIHSSPQELLPALGEGEQFIQVGADSFYKPVRFRILASSRMITRDKLMQVFPFIAQTLMAGPFMAQLQKSGRTVDFETLLQMLQDATGTGRMYKLIRPMNEQEQQASQQPPPEVVAEQQRAQQDAQVRLQMGQMKSQTDLQVAQIKQQKSPMDLMADQQKMQSDAALAQQKLELEQQKAQLAIAQKQAELQLKQVEGQMKQQHMAAEHQFKLQSLADERQQSMLDHLFGMQQASQEHSQNLEQSRAAGEQDLELKRQQATVKPPKEEGPVKKKNQVRPKAR